MFLDSTFSRWVLKQDMFYSQDPETIGVNKPVSELDKRGK